MITPAPATRWLALALLIVSLSAFVYSLRLRARDWGREQAGIAVAAAPAIGFNN